MASYLDEVRYNIKHYRRSRNISQAALAEKCDCSPGTIGGIESGRTKPSFDMMVSIADALKVHPGDLFIKDASKSKAELKDHLYAQLQSVLEREFENAEL